jgi:AmmeMemoRadiSam system protein B
MGSAAGKSSGTCSYTRGAYHAGSWYDDDPAKLDAALSDFLVQAAAAAEDDDEEQQQQQRTPPGTGRLRAVVVPHAGYSYSGPTAAHAYAALRRELLTTGAGGGPAAAVRQIVVLHPSHHEYLAGCAVSGAVALETPVGNLPVDDALRREVLQLSNKFTIMKKSTDEHEHSGEMQYPYLAKILRDCRRTDVTVTPIMCGALSTKQEEYFGRLLADILSREHVLTVVSTDFCHWGRRFSYQPVSSDDDKLPIAEYIEQLDRRGMDLIALQRPGAFATYLQETRNTVCGRHAVAVWLRALESVGDSAVRVRFVRYAQSNAAKSMHDSSVSYAAAIAVKEEIPN